MVLSSLRYILWSSFQSILYPINYFVNEPEKFALFLDSVPCNWRILDDDGIVILAQQQGKYDMRKVPMNMTFVRLDQLRHWRRTRNTLSPRLLLALINISNTQIYSEGQDNVTVCCHNLDKEIFHFVLGHQNILIHSRATCVARNRFVMWFHKHTNN